MDATARLDALVVRSEADPRVALAERSRGDALALELGGDLALRWRLALLRAVMSDPPDGDAVRELYGELCDRYRDDTAAMAKIRPFGDEIRKREQDGTLPSALVARSERRKKT